MNVLTIDRLVVPIIKLIGLSMGFLIWSVVSLIGGYIIGEFGLFGVESAYSSTLANRIFNITGNLI